MMGMQIVITSLLIGWGVIANAQHISLPPPSNNPLPFAAPQPHAEFPYEARCGDPSRESMLFLSVEGQVIEVIDINRIKLALDSRRTRQVELVALEPFNLRQANEGRRMLADLVLNQRIEVLINPSQRNASRLLGVARLNNRDINLALLEAGMARFREPASYSMSRHRACVYQIVASEAQDARRGLWQSVSQ